MATVWRKYIFKTVRITDSSIQCNPENFLRGRDKTNNL